MTHKKELIYFNLKNAGRTGRTYNSSAQDFLTFFEENFYAKKWTKFGQKITKFGRKWTKFGQKMDEI